MIDDGFHVTAVEGVPTFVAPGPGPTAMGLVFRVGVVDETLPTHGLTHLVEHLALLDAPGAAPADAATGLEVTTFSARGRDEELVASFARIGTALQDLPLHRLDLERRALQAEAAQRPRRVEGELLNWRFGPRSWGLVDWPELGVEHLGPEAVQDWARRRFVQGNAALWVQGRVPAGLRLGLAPGPSWPLPPVVPLDDPLPAVSTHDLANVTISLLVPRSPAAPIALAMLGGRCRQRLRTAEGRVRELTSTHTPLGAHHCLVTVGADCPPDEADAVLDGVLAELGVLATLGPDPAEVEAARREMVRAAGGPAFRDWSVVAAAQASVRREAPSTPQELLERRLAVTAEEIRLVLDLGRESAQLLVPAGVVPRDRRYRSARLTSPTPVTGRSVRRARASADASAHHVLTVGPDGVSIAFDDHHHGVVRWAACAAVEQFSNGARVLVGTDRLELVVHPEEWEQGHQIVALIDRDTPQQRRVPVDRPLASSYLDQLDRSAAVASEPGGPLEATASGRRRRRR